MGEGAIGEGGEEFDVKRSVKLWIERRWMYRSWLFEKRWMKTFLFLPG